jgi:ketosteroid isomerase-like protein
MPTVRPPHPLRRPHRRPFATAAALAAAAAAAACAAPGPLVLGDPTATGVRAVIDAAWRGHIAGAQQKDLDAVVAMYADDIVYVIEQKQPVTGKAAVRAMEQRAMASGEVGTVHHSIDALRVDGDLAYELGSVVGDVTPTGRAPQHVVFHFVALWRCGPDDVWRLAHLVGQAEAALPPPPAVHEPHSMGS